MDPWKNRKWEEYSIYDTAVTNGFRLFLQLPLVDYAWWTITVVNAVSLRLYIFSDKGP